MTGEAIPFLDLVTSHRELEEELVQVFRTALRSAAFVGGPEVQNFEQEFAEYTGAMHAVAVGSGTDALRFALMAAGVGPGDAVVTVAHTFIATIEGISQSGAETEFVDIDERTYNMCPLGLARYLDGCRKDTVTGRPLGLRTGKPIKAVVPVHLYGQVADMDAILQTAERYGLLVIEDACQAHGAEYQFRSGSSRRRAGSFGRAAAFSFYPGKNLGACGEAGAVTTDDPELARIVAMLRDHGQKQKYHHDLEGYNGRMDAIQAGFLRLKLRRLDSWNSDRRAAALRYKQLLSSIPSIHPPFEPDESRAVYHLYVIRTSHRDALAEHLKADGISTGLHYPVPVHLQQCYKAWGYRAGSLPVTEVVAAEILSLPMYPSLTPEQQQRIKSQIERFVSVVTAS
jgi:dTDP-4-amino-4,6-dideoxygalactose transaminase